MIANNGPIRSMCPRLYQRWALDLTWFGLDPDYDEFCWIWIGPGLIFFINLAQDRLWTEIMENLYNFCCWKAVCYQSFGFYLGLDFKLLQNFGLWLDLDWSLKILDWIWIAKYYSPLMSATYAMRLHFADWWLKGLQLLGFSTQICSF